MIRATTKRIDWAAVKATLCTAETAFEQSSLVDEEKLQDIFRKRAERLAAGDVQARPAVETVPVLVSRVGNERYGVELRAVAQVFPDTRITPVPGAPYPLLGVANLEGEVRSVFGLRRLLALPESDDWTSHYILLVRQESRRVGLQVERIDGVRQITVEDVIEYEDPAAEKHARYVRGMTGDKVSLLRTESLFDC